MILYNSALNYQILKGLQDPAYGGLHLFGGTPPTRTELITNCGLDSSNRIRPYDIHIFYSTLFYMYWRSTSVPTKWKQDNKSKLKLSHMNGLSSQNTYIQDGTATWFMLAWTAGRYPDSSRADATKLTILGSIGDLDSNADLKVIDPTISASTAFTTSDILIDHDIFEFMI